MNSYCQLQLPFTNFCYFLQPWLLCLVHGADNLLTVVCVAAEQVICTFDKEMEQLRSATIRITRLATADTMEPGFRTMLRQKFIEGLIVA
jgi:hypothetical protein